MTERPVRPPRATSRDVTELTALKKIHPELSDAIDVQLALIEINKRVQGRVPLPWMQPDAAWLAAQQRDGRPAVRFADIPLDWSDFRLTMRQVSDVLQRHGALDPRDYERILAISRDGHTLEPLVAGWYTATSHVDAAKDVTPADLPAGLDQVFLLALRPFLSRCADALMPRPEFQSWRQRLCPVCGWEADFATITPDAERHLICGRCLAQWIFDPLACPYCDNHDRARITSFATRDGRYRVYACDVCQRYLKAYDGRSAARPVLIHVDAIATLPLDAAAIQRGYRG
ncbi:MAG: formate dehydrogenase accessory protein FdhE [Acidobacteriaceae bacterium]|nr:formate dehydrogenase accessory protein FdhE [Acidobacteriaceae bacterium]